MRLVIVGDIGWKFLYHLGDEAMTEAALDASRARGVDEVTLVAAQPAVSAEFYGVPTVGRIGFRTSPDRARNEGLFAKLESDLARGHAPAGTLMAAIRDTDAVVIAGGGNMNTRDYHLLYERVAVTRIAKHFGKPLYVSSQTVGPALSPQDASLVSEIAEYALAFGCREEETLALMRRLSPHPERVHRTFDDGLLLEADARARVQADELTAGRESVIASFTFHHGNSWASRQGYYRDIAALCTYVADEFGLQVLLVPHAGSFDAAQTQRDQDGNARIAELARHERVTTTRMVTAREDIALLERSPLSLSTRYHPLVFSSALGTPAIGIAPSFYSLVRMRGALGNIGLEDYVLSHDAFPLAPAAIADALRPTSAFRAHMARAKEAVADTQNAWWDALIAAARAGRTVDFAPVAPLSRYVTDASWVEENKTMTHHFARFARTADERDFARTQLAGAEQRNSELVAQLAETRNALNRYKNRRVIRILDGLRRT